MNSFNKGPQRDTCTNVCVCVGTVWQAIVPPLCSLHCLCVHACVCVHVCVFVCARVCVSEWEVHSEMHLLAGCSSNSRSCLVVGVDRPPHSPAGVR